MLSHLAPAEWASPGKQTANTDKDVGIKDAFSTAREIEMNAAVMEISMNFSDIRTTIGWQLWDIDPKNSKSTYYKDTCPSFLFALLVTIARIWNQTRCLSTLNG